MVLRPGMLLGAPRESPHVQPRRCSGLSLASTPLIWIIDLSDVAGPHVYVEFTCLARMAQFSRIRASMNLDPVRRPLVPR